MKILIQHVRYEYIQKKDTTNFRYKKYKSVHSNYSLIHLVEKSVILRCLFIHSLYRDPFNVLMVCRAAKKEYSSVKWGVEGCAYAVLMMARSWFSLRYFSFVISIHFPHLFSVLYQYTAKALSTPIYTFD